MSQTPNYDANVKLILDALEPGERVCALTGEKWMMTEEEIGWYKKFNVPPSKVSPQTRWKNHGIWYVGYQYWYQNHPVTGKPLICTVHPATGIKVLPDKEWFEKDFVSAGRDYTLDNSFFEQWRELQLSVPMPANRNHVEPTNSIAFVSQGDEGSYFVGASKTKRCCYTHAATDCEDSAEIYQGLNVINSYNVVHSNRIHNSKFVRESSDCLNCAFIFDCRNCEFCFGATNKRNKKYLWFNEQLSKEEWEKRFAEVDLGSRVQLQQWKKDFFSFMQQAIWPENFNDQVEASSGEYLNKTVRVTDSYFCGPGSAYQSWCNYSLGQSEQCAFTGYAVNGSEIYYSASISGRGQKFCFLTIRSDNMEYCLLCYNCRDCFGCIGLQRKQFCIFNKQYSEEEYWKRLDELKCAMLERGEYGEFYPARFSPTYPNDSGAPYWFGAVDAELKNMGAMDFDPESQNAIGTELADPSKMRQLTELPDHIKELGDDWIGVPLFDSKTRRRFALIAPEVAFYRRMNIAPPSKHFISRVQDLWLEANQGNFFDSRCQHCRQNIRVSRNAAYPNRTLYCKPCYLQFIEQNG